MEGTFFFSVFSYSFALSLLEPQHYPHCRFPLLSLVQDLVALYVPVNNILSNRRFRHHIRLRISTRKNGSKIRLCSWSIALFSESDACLPWCSR
jgi:hypothetical protein